ncbi:VWA domain-containing protein [Kitasatospora sp. NPDC088783]|uniref:VWA domain-containing protein n=1 Tax=Kitasatospora sp. NPDC088783 TaxID=3364077 RepID=UPI0037F1CAAD
MFKKFFTSAAPAAGPAAPAAAPAGSASVSLRKDIVTLTKSAQESLASNDLAGQRAAVYLVLDRSGSMSRHYRNGTMQYLGEQALGLSRALDDDGRVPVVFFSTGLDGTTVLDLDNYAGRIDTAHRQLGAMGRTNYTRAIRAVIEHYRESGATDPAFVLFQTDGSPDDRRETEQMLIAAKELPMFWSFVGFGDNIGFLQTIDDLPGIVDNTGFFHVPDPLHLDDEALYTGVTAQFRTYLVAARAAGILR